jgi:predicted NUDIX family phosphoesterase
VAAAALRELEEETGLSRSREQIEPVGFINSDREDVSSVHFGVVFRVALDDLPQDDDALCDRVCAQAEPHRALWIPRDELAGLMGDGAGPDDGTFEDWSRITVGGLAEFGS